MGLNCYIMNTEDVITRIGFFRNRANLSGRELSLRIGKSTSFITKIDSGDFGVTLPVLFDIFKVFDITAEEFFSDNYATYRKDHDIDTLFRRLTDKSKDAVVELMKNLK